MFSGLLRICILCALLLTLTESSADQHAQVKKMNDKDFDDLLSTATNVLILFSKACCTCEMCVEAEAVLAAKRYEIQDFLDTKVYILQEQPDLLKRFAPNHPLPQLIYFRKKVPALYGGPIHHEKIMSWLQTAKDSSVVQLNDDSFEHLTQATSGSTTGNWLVYFTHEDIGVPLNTLSEGLAARVKQHTSVAFVDLKKSPALKERFGFNKDMKSPKWFFFRQGKMYTLPLSRPDVNTMEGFVTKAYTNFQGLQIPQPQTPFDAVVSVALDVILKRIEVAFAIGFAFIAFVSFLCCCAAKRKSVAEIKKD